MFGEKGEAVAGTGEAPAGSHPYSENPVGGKWPHHILPGTKPKPEDHCVSVHGPASGREAAYWCSWRGASRGAFTPSLARRAPTKPGVWPMGVPRSGSQAGVTGSSWVSPRPSSRSRRPRLGLESAPISSPHWRTSAPLRPLSSFELQGFSETSQIKSFSLTAS